MLVWAVLIAARMSSPVTEVAAAASFVLGGVGFGLANDDVASIVVAVITTAVLALGFPHAQRAANRLLDRPSVVGFHGRTVAIRPAVVRPPAGPPLSPAS